MISLMQYLALQSSCYWSWELVGEKFCQVPRSFDLESSCYWSWELVGEQFCQVPRSFDLDSASFLLLPCTGTALISICNNPCPLQPPMMTAL